MRCKRRPDNEPRLKRDQNPVKPAAGGLTLSGPALMNGLAAVPFAWLVLFFLLPLLATLAVSFMHSTFGGVEARFTLENYETAMSGFYLASFLRSLRFAAIGAALCISVSYPAALFIARQPPRRRALLLLAVLVPYFTSFLIRVMSWQILLARGGPLQWLLNTLHLWNGPIDLLDTQTAVFIGLVYAYMPITIVPLFIVLSRIPAEYAEASLDLGASQWRTFWHVTLPLSRPGLATAALLTTVPMMGELVIPMLLGGDKGVLIGMVITSQYLGAQNYPAGSALAVLVLAAAAVIVAFLAWLSNGFSEASA